MKNFIDLAASIKDSLIQDDYLYITYTKEMKEHCYNISVLRSKVNFGS